jgi:hypothetical protein
MPDHFPHPYSESINIYLFIHFMCNTSLFHYTGRLLFYFKNVVLIENALDLVRNFYSIKLTYIHTTNMSTARQEIIKTKLVEQESSSEYLIRS